jgi:hypothetical protein
MDARATLIAEISRLSARERRLISHARETETIMQPEPDKLAALIDTARALEKAGVRYALIGGLAVGIHAGVPRATVDVDVAAYAGGGRRDIAVTALEEAGFTKTGEFEHSVNFRHASGEPVQLAFDPDFDAMIERAETMNVAGTKVAVVRKEDLIAMKQRAAADPSRRKSKRLRDQADIELLLGDVPDPDEGW